MTEVVVCQSLCHNLEMEASGYTCYCITLFVTSTPLINKMLPWPWNQLETFE